MSERVVRREVIAAEPVEAMAGLLDVDPPRDGQVPELWHWVHLLERRPSRDLGADGHPTSGIPAPPGPGMRRMFAGGRVETRRRLRVGEPATRTTWVASEAEKQGRSGPLRLVTVRHEIHQADELAIAEEQDIVYRAPGGSLPMEPGAGLPVREPTIMLDVDERLLFRFSALTYNAHRIHYDRAWCTREGYDDLVVHGPLQALMMGELARRNGLSLVGRRFGYRLVSPMVGPQRMHVLPADDGLAGGAEVRTADGRVTAVSSLAGLG
ncbi:MAG TPA: MaoC family dehydratase N-terminal domain-containing protein [Marmoricola sp.]